METVDLPEGEYYPGGLSAFDPEEYFDIYKGMAEAALPMTLFFTQVEERALALGRRLVQLLFVVLGIGFLVLAWRAQAGSYKEDLYVNLSSGAWFFWAAEFVVRWGRRHRVLVPLVGAGVAALILAGARDLAAFPRTVLVGDAVALLMLVSLELSLTPWLDRLSRAHESLKRECADLKNRVE